ncbi:ankyrin repeat domain-containing protein [Serratia nevei]|uniref:ankyrin repeat domain-containing protein n=1 Tax=Serratia nevei TaxID=2703794 RepID=UPI0037DCD9F8
MRQVFNVFAALFIAIGLMLTTGCKEKGMDLPPEGYFTGQQLVLAKAIRDGNIGDIKRLAKETDLNSPGEHDMTLLFFALATSTHDNATSERLQIATELVKAGADPLQPRPNGGASPAEWMAKLDNGIWLKALLDGGLSPDARGKVDELPIIFQTSKARNSETLKVLVAHGANLEARDILGQTVVMDAFRYSSFDNVKYLLNNGANPNPINKRGVSLVEMVSKEIKNSKEGGEYNDECLTIKKMMIERGVKWPRS